MLFLFFKHNPNPTAMSAKTFTWRGFSLIFLIFTSFQLFAREGMWLPSQIKSREGDMRSLGLRIPVEQLYNEQGTGLNNAVVLFGKGCTGEVISAKGLVLTNHHCGYGSVQGLSSNNHDYFAEGFWAMNMSQEIPCPGLTVTFVRKMENVSENILYNLSDDLDEASRDTLIAHRISNLLKGYRKAYPGLDATIQPFYGGNQFWVILTETYKDIRLVGFPPNGIGNFGGDTDNWMWPRHNGDFSMFRIYAGTDNKPADYNKANKPYKPVRFFPIATNGYQEGDFTMVYGFPGYTQEYISSSQLNQVYSVSDPIRIAVRTQRLNIWKDAMHQNRDVFLKYTAKSNGIANGWKKWQGEVRGLTMNNVMQIKRDREQAFQEWATMDTSSSYDQQLLADITAAATHSNNALRAEEYIREAVLGIELINQGNQLDKILQALHQGKGPDELKKMQPTWDAFFRNYDAAVDQKVFTALMPMFIGNNPDYVPQWYRTMMMVYKGNYESWANNTYKTSLVTHPDKLRNLLGTAEERDTAVILSDPAWQLYHAISGVRDSKITPLLRTYYGRLERLNRLYMASQMQYGNRMNFYSDANLTLRIAYGQVHGIDPDGPAPYSYQTNLDEVIRKDQPGDDEFSVPERLKNLFVTKNYGRWKSNNTVPVAFIADNHTTGGNSGSPVLNGKGQLIGINFDRIWEGTMSDLYFDPNLSRNISVDIRYVLFIVDKYGGAGWLLKEMQLQK